MGFPKIRNVALKKLSDSYVIYVDRDDMFHKDKLLFEAEEI